MMMIAVVVLVVVVVFIVRDDVVYVCTNDTSVCASTFGESWRCTEHSTLGLRYCSGSTTSTLQKQSKYSKYVWK